MKSDHVVCAILLTADRQESTERAIRSWLTQDYQDKRLLVYDTGVKPFVGDAPSHRGTDRRTIGALRNAANHLALREFNPHILCHWDSDDWSAPMRLSEQVALLRASGADAVGYGEMLFWLTGSDKAWLYSNPSRGYALGTSLCYWRKAWEGRPFEQCNSGEDRAWLRGVACHPMTSLLDPELYATGRPDNDYPRMIATLHGGNTSSRIVREATNPDGSPTWTRVPWWDKQVRSRIEAA